MRKITFHLFYLLIVFNFFFNTEVVAQTTDVVITEIMYNPDSPDSSWEWIEIYNKGTEPINLTGYVLDDNSSSSFTSANISGGILEAGSSAILFDAEAIPASEFLDAWGTVTLVPVDNWPVLNNSGDGLAIWDSFTNYTGDHDTQVNAIEQVTYTNSAPWPVADGFGSIFLKDLNTDNSIGANWELSIDGVTTPLYSAYKSTVVHGNTGNDIGSPGIAIAAQKPFITTWKTDNFGGSENNQIVIPTDSNYSYNYSVDWGDGTATENVTGNITHTYLISGTYVVSIRGVFPKIDFDHDSNYIQKDREKILSIEQWGDLSWLDMSGSFVDCIKLNVKATDVPELSQVNSLRYTFSGCSSLSGNSSFENWDTATINNMGSMFFNCEQFNGNIANWNTSNVTDMAFMFSRASSFNQDISQWDTSNLEGIVAMFAQASSFNQDLNNWNVSKAKNFGGVFRSASTFDQDLSNWNISNATNLSGMFTNSGLSNENYDKVLISWSQLPNLESNIQFGAATNSYCEAVEARQSLIDNYGWVIEDLGQAYNCGPNQQRPFIFNIKTDNVGISEVNQIIIPTFSGEVYNYTVNWGDGSVSENVTSNITHTYETPGTYSVSVLGQFPRIFFNNNGDVEKIIAITQWGDIAWSSMENSFYGCSLLDVTAMDTPNFSGVVSMNGMFRECESLMGNYIIWNWNTDTIEDMSNLFRGASLFNQSIRNWDVGGVKFMSHMLSDASSFNQDLTTWNISLVESMDSLFNGSKMSLNNYDKLLLAWSSLESLQNNVQLGAVGLQYCQDESVESRQELIDKYNWVISGDTRPAECLIEQRPFITTWKTDNPGISEDNQITIPTYPGETYNYMVDWGDGTTSENVTDNITHTYTIPGVYTVSINGFFPSIYLVNGGTAVLSSDAQKLLTIEQWGDIRWTNMSAAFNGCKNMDVMASDVPNLSDVISMGAMFSGCSSLVGNSAFENWSMSNVKVMFTMFSGAQLFNQNISSWDVSNVEIISSMFQNATSFNQDIGNWNVSKVIHMGGLLTGATSFNQDIGSWDVSAVTDMQYMFTGVTLSQENYDNTLIGWNTLDIASGETQIPQNITFSGGNSQYCLSEAARQNLIDTFGWTITDGGIQCLDTEVPVIACPTNVTMGNDTGLCEATFPIVIATATDDVSLSENIVIDFVRSDNELLSLTDPFPVGETIITWTATDEAGNVSESCEQTITVNDVEIPTIVCPENQEIVINDGDSAAYSIIAPTGTDLCSGFEGTTNVATFVGVRNDGLEITAAYPLGETIITWTSFDEVGNESDPCDQTITVIFEDTEVPVITCPENVVQGSDTGLCAALFPMVAPTATDNVSTSFTFLGVRSDGLDVTDPFPVGETTITWTATDEAMNVSESCEQTITINDTEAPTITCPDNISVSSSIGNPVVVTIVDATAIDACDTTPIISGERSDTLSLTDPYSVGTTTILWTAIDAEGNGAQCAQTVTVNFIASMNNDITVFTIPNQEGVSIINESEKTVALVMPFGTDITALAPSIGVSSGAIISPATDVAQDFTNPITYSVTAQDNSTQDWSISVTTAADTTAPELELTSPINGSSNVVLDSNLILEFNERVSVKDGVLYFYKKGIIGGYGFSPKNNIVSNTNGIVVINPPIDLDPNEEYYIFIEAGTFEDESGNVFTGITEANTWAFSTIITADKIAPKLASSTPVDDEVGISLDTNIKLVFDEPVKIGTSNGVVTNPGSSEVLGIIYAHDLTAVGNEVTFNLPITLLPNTTYAIGLGEGVIEDLAGNDFIELFVDQLTFTTGPGSLPFVTTWQTDNAGSSEDNQITIPTFPGETYNYTIDWGDGTINTEITGDITHTYDVAGIYVVAISGDFPRIYFNKEGDKEKILEVNNWGDNEWSSMSVAFRGCSNLDIPATDIPDFSMVESLNSMFNGCIKLEGTPNFNDWDVSNVVSMNSLFSHASLFNQNISGWDISNVRDIEYMFTYASNFNQPIGNWDVSNITSMASLFAFAARFNQDISGWDVGNLKNGEAMFLYATDFNQNISKWNVNNLDFALAMFEAATSFNQNLGEWDVFKLSEATQMFFNAGLSVENYDSTLIGWADLELQVGVNFGVGNVQYCLGEASRLKIINDFGWTINDAGKAEGCSVEISTEEIWLEAECAIVGSDWTFVSDVSASNRQYLLPAVGNTYAKPPTVVDEATILRFNFNAEAGTYKVYGLVSTPSIDDDSFWVRANGGNWVYWNSIPGTSDFSWQQVHRSANGPVYATFNLVEGENNIEIVRREDGTGLDKLFVTKTELAPTGQGALAINCEAVIQRPFVTTWQTDNTGVSNDNEITIPTFSGEIYNYTVDWGDGISDTGVTGDITHTYDVSGAYEVSISGDFPSIRMAANSDKKKLIEINQWGDVEWSTMKLAFAGCSNLDVKATDIPDLSQVNSLYQMFQSCSSLVANESMNNWDTSNINNLSGMFVFVFGFNQDINNWDVSNVTDMSSLFANTNYNQGLSDWDVSSVTNMSAMFAYSNFNQDISSWNVENVTDMSEMFAPSPFNQDIRSWSVPKVTNMRAMFRESPFNQNIGEWDVSMVENMTEMFNMSSALSDENYDAILMGWSSLSTLQSNVNLGAENAKFCQAEAARQSLIDNYGWAINDAGKPEDCQNEVSADEIWLEAECAIVGSDWTIVSDGSASNGQYLLPAVGNTYAKPPTVVDEETILRFNFNAKAGTYKVYGLVSTPSIDDDSFWVRANGGGWVYWNSIPGTLDFSWQQVHRSANGPVYAIFNLVEGANNIEIVRREDGTGLDKIFITKTETVPSGQGYSATNCEEIVQRPFVTTWKTNNSGVTTDNQISIPTNPDEIYNYSIDWGDGSLDEGVTENITHTYASSGSYTVSITGVFPQFFMDDSLSNGSSSDSYKLLEVNSWGDIIWKSMEHAFSGCQNMDVVATDVPNLSLANSLDSTFEICKSMVGNDSFKNWDVSNITNMEATFYGTRNFNVGLSNWDVANVVNLRTTFAESRYNGDIGNWNVSKVIYMDNMFAFNTVFNQDISGWDVGNVTDMRVMFYTATSFNQPIGNWNTSKVTSINEMFSYATSFNQDIGNWDVGNVIELRSVFREATSFNQDISNWNVSNVTDMADIFNTSGLSNENYDKLLIGWSQLSSLQNGVQLDAPQNEYCEGEQARQSIIDIYGWTITDAEKALDCSAETSTDEIWLEAECAIVGSDWTFVSDVSASNGQYLLPAVGNTYAKPPTVVDEATILRFNFNAEAGIYKVYGLVSTPSIDDDSFWVRANGGNWVYWNSIPGASDFSWQQVHRSANGPVYATFNLVEGANNIEIVRREDGTGLDKLFVTKTANMPSGQGYPATNCEEIVQRPFVTTWKTDNPGVSNNNQITLYYDGTVDWGDGTSNTGTGNITHTYSSPGIYTVSFYGITKSPVIQDEVGSDREKILTIEQWGDGKWSYLKYAFSNCLNLDVVANDVPDLSELELILYEEEIQVYKMFNGCSSLVGNSSFKEWGVSNIGGFGAMFNGAVLFNQDISNWNMSKAVYTFEMFKNAPSFNQDIGNWDISNVINTSSMFEGATSFNQDLSDWNVSGVQNLVSIFNATNLSNENYDKILVGWWSQQTTSSDWIVFDAPQNQYCKATEARQKLIDDYGWTINDAGKASDCSAEANTDEIWLEAECAIVGSDWTFVNDTTASNGQYLLPAVGNTYAKPPTAVATNEIVRFDFTAEAGTYNMYALVSTPSIDDDSFWVRANGGDWVYWNSIPGTTDFSWQQVHRSVNGPVYATFNLVEGANNIEIVRREDGTGLDKIFVTKTATVPLGQGYSATNCEEVVQRPFVTTWKTDNPGVSDDNQITLYYDGTVDWGDGTSNTGTGNITHTYSSSGIYTVAFYGITKSPVIQDEVGSDREKILTIEQWGDGKWSYLKSAFSNCSNLDVVASDVPDLSELEVILYEDEIQLYKMFNGCNSLIGASSFENWDVSNVGGFGSMFNEAILFNQDISNWNMSKAVYTFEMFKNAGAFNQDIGNWDMSNIINTNSMFEGASSFNQNISDWEFNYLIWAANMFNLATSFDQNLGDWKINNLADATGMFLGAGLSVENYDKTLLGWSIGSLVPGVIFDAGNSQYCASESARQYIIDTFNWTIIDAGKFKNCSNEVSADEIWLEAECAIVGSDWTFVEDTSASNGQYLLPAVGNNYSKPPTVVDEATILRFNFNAEAGTYKVYGLVSTPSIDDDSFWVRANGGGWVYWNSIPGSSDFSWQQVHRSANGPVYATFNLLEGENNIEIVRREDGTGLDKIFVTKTNTLPTALGSDATNCNEGNEIVNKNAETGKTTLNEMSVYPNPAVSNVTASFDEPTEVETIMVFDMLGRLVQTYNAKEIKHDGDYELNVNYLQPGTYFVRTVDVNGFYFQKQMVIRK